MSNPVFLFLLDGVRPDALEAAHTPNLDAFRNRSSYTMSAHSLMPTITLPCHMAMFYSVPAERHGVTTNTFTPLARPLPSIVDQVATNRKKAAFFTSWDGFSALHQPGHLDFSFMHNYADVRGVPRLHIDEAVTAAVCQFVPQIKSDFTFIYYGTTDSAGHIFGWMSDGYLKQVEKVDQLFGQALASLPEDAVILVQADHGGHEKTHGTDLLEDVLIPWMIAGPGIKQGYEISGEVSLLNTAPTLAHFLQVPTHGNWVGTIVADIFS